MAERKRGLLVVADDGGVDTPRDRGILDVLREGVVRNVAVMANGPHAADLAEALRGRGGLSVVLHFNLTEGSASGGPAATLTGPDGAFPGDKREVWERARAGRIDPAEVEREVAAQAARLRELGLEPVALNGHNHVHLLPGVREGVVRALGRDPTMRWIRIPAEPAPPPGTPAVCVDEPVMPCDARDYDGTALEMKAAGHTALASVRALAGRTVHGLPGRIRFPDAFLGFAFACTGSAVVLEAGLEAVEGGLVELMVHPGRSAPEARSPFSRDPAREAERRVLLSAGFRRCLERAGFEPLSFAEAAAGGAGTAGSP